MTIKEIEIKVYYCRDCNGEVVYYKTIDNVDIWKCDKCKNKYEDLHIVKHKHTWIKVKSWSWHNKYAWCKCGCLRVINTYYGREYRYYYPRR